MSASHLQYTPVPSAALHRSPMLRRLLAATLLSGVALVSLAVPASAAGPVRDACVEVVHEGVEPAADLAGAGGLAHAVEETACPRLP